MNEFYCRFLWGASGTFLGVYNIVQDLNVPLIVQPQVLSFLSLLSWAQVSSMATLLYYGSMLTDMIYLSANTMGRSDHYELVWPSLLVCYSSSADLKLGWCTPFE
jgi:hypothetical protein